MKIGLAMIKEDSLLVVRKRGTVCFILPGGKPEGRENDLEALRRELREELGCVLVAPRFAGAFTDKAADLRNTVVTVRLYAGRLRGEPQPASEIEELAWVKLTEPVELPLAPSITNKILPYLRAHLTPKAGASPRRRATPPSTRPVHA
jgi:8-oxo-dGTP diphosphatase